MGYVCFVSELIIMGIQISKRYLIIKITFSFRIIMHVQNKKYVNFVSISGLTGKSASQKLKNFCSSSLWTCLHHMVILKSQNKITDFFLILA